MKENTNTKINEVSGKITNYSSANGFTKFLEAIS